MPKRVSLKTSKTNTNVATYINTLPAAQQADATALVELFTKTTKAEARLWGTSIIGFGEYTYHRSNGDEGVFMATGFSMRKSGPTVYIMPGYQDYSDILATLGPHKLGKSCLYLKRLSDIDLQVLKKLITVGLRDLRKSHQVTMK